MTRKEVPVKVFMKSLQSKEGLFDDLGFSANKSRHGKSSMGHYKPEHLVRELNAKLLGWLNYS